MARVILLTNNSTTAKIVADRINKVLPLTAVIAGGKKIKKINWLTKIKRLISINIYLLFRTTRLYRQVTKLEKKLRKRAEKILYKKLNIKNKTRIFWPHKIQILETDNINNEVSLLFLKKKQPDLLLVFGTPILKDYIINTAQTGVLNAHSSLLPAYKGTFVEFWQILNNDREKAGITIHLVDTNVDTGDILYQEGYTDWQKDIDPYLLRTYNLLKVIDNYGKVAKKFLNGEITPKKQGGENSSTYKFKDINFEKKVALFKKLKYLN